MSEVQALISDFGGVLTSPLQPAFVAFQQEVGIPLEGLGRALARVTEEDGRHPLFELETGRLAEADFLARVERALQDELGRAVSMSAFTERYWAALTPNEELVEHLRGLRARGLRLALLTNNVREWEARWRAMIPVDELFELVVDSAWVGVRKPDPEIYELTLQRLGLPAQACVFLDDFQHNCQAAEALGIRSVWFRDTAQAIADLDALLG